MPRELRVADLTQSSVLLIGKNGAGKTTVGLALEILHPQHLADKVFILGALTKPEALKPALGPYEEIGSKLAQDCREETDDTWGHALLQHNANELVRLRAHGASDPVPLHLT